MPVEREIERKRDREKERERERKRERERRYEVWGKEREGRRVFFSPLSNAHQEEEKLF